MKKEKRIPTIIGLSILIISIFAGIFLTTGNRRIFSPKASGDCTPINHQVTNVTSNSFDVSFTTSVPCLSSIIIDNRTIQNFRNTASRVHYFQISNLKESTFYPFSFLNNGSSFSAENYRAQTGKNPQRSLSGSNLAWGRVLNPNSTPASEAIVYLNIPGASPLSSFVTTNGNWNIPLASSFNENRDDWFIPSDNIQEEIIVISSDRTTQIINNTSNNNPVPDITIGVNSFENNIVPTTSIGNINQAASINTNKSLTINSPQEGESLSNQRPDFFGTAAINSSVSLKIDLSNNITGQVTSDSSGVWHWSPSENLSVGEHTLNVTGFNSISSREETIDRRFTIVDNSNLLSFSATPSAIIVTPIPTLFPTAIPTIRTMKPSTTSGVPVTGTTLPTLLFLIIASVFIVFSFVIFNNKKSDRCL